MSLNHVLREHNIETDLLSYEVYQVGEGKVIYEEYREGIVCLLRKVFQNCWKTVRSLKLHENENSIYLSSSRGFLDTI